MSVALLPLRGSLRLGGEILEQHAMYENVPTTNLAKKDASSSIVEETNVIERSVIMVPKYQTQGKMVKTSRKRLSLTSI